MLFDMLDGTLGIARIAKIAIIAGIEKRTTAY